jgi:uncharacterized protein with von Willebrand factor type A (vWA) domain
MFGDETPYILQTKMFINTIKKKKKSLHKRLVVRVSDVLFQEITSAQRKLSMSRIIDSTYSGVI